ncbi:MAG TPA: DUF4097 family beta strand repeat-containing protein [Actinophytocola sp.]|uniref:DUF4097 family beta strand repeat-containing protein n=1 Tax=Actinophytocola sp. TaxID=1872138 RepID=UPI002DDCAB11|nr:DUF4097 family beta strand repeat-containing protein [Actinophytocola sp.]HEV2780677.1 DUF4097 family beta strand repeat-containing protein [Actinophytocola sp.]
MGRGLLVTTLGAGLLLVGACGWWGDARNTEVDDATVDARITSVRIANEAGAVTIRAGDRATVHRSIHYDRDRPGPTHQVEGDTLVIESCKPDNCWIDYEVTVPAGVRVNGAVDSGKVDVEGVAGVNLKVESGAVTVRKVAGQVNLEVSSGRVNLTDIGDAVAVKSSSGSVTVDQARGAVTVHSDSGTVSVRLATVQNVVAQADSGSIDVTVPPGAYRVTASTDSGRVTNGVPNDPAAGHRIDLHTDSGSITVKQG